MDERIKQWAQRPDILRTGCYAILVGFAFIAFLPASLHIFSLKNDALTYFLPYRYHVSEAIRSGQFPFWSPYLYLGMPLHSDIQSGVWNPVVMMLSLVRRYDMGLMQWELVFYLIAGGIGFFNLCRYFGCSLLASLALAISYMGSGFITDSVSFMPWVTSAAWLPFAIQYFLSVLERPSASNSIKAAVSGFLLFTAGYMSFFIITSYLFLAIAIAEAIRLFRSDERKTAAPRLKFLGLAALVWLLLSLPALVSYLEFLPSYQRGHGMSREDIMVNPFELDNTLSYLFPPASYKVDSMNDITSRNAFIGILPLVFFFYSLFHAFDRRQNFIAGATFVFFILSLGAATPLRGMFYYLPFMDSFRHPSNFRLFTTLGLLLLAGYGMRHFEIQPLRARFRRLIGIFAGVIVLFLLFHASQGGLQEIAKMVKGFDRSGKGFKNLLDSSQLSFWLLASGLVQLMVLAVAFVLPRKWIFAALCFANMAAMVWLCAPFTIVSQLRTHQVNAFLFSHPRGFPLDQGSLPLENRPDDPSLLTPMGYTSFYEKRFTIQDHQVTPTLADAYARAIGDTSVRSQLAKHAVAYFLEGDSLGIHAIRANEFVLTPANSQARVLHLSQQYNKNWQAYADDQPVAVEKDNGAFMKASIPASTRVVRFVYRPSMVILLSWVALAVLLGCIALLGYFRWTKHE